MHKILIIEDDPRISSFIIKGLNQAGFKTDLEADGETGLATASQQQHDLIVLDIGLPKLDGFTLMQRLRARDICTPIIMLTARDSVNDTVAGLENGANDYMTKPFQFAELLARIRLRLTDTPTPETPAIPLLERDGVVLNLHSREVTVDGKITELTSREFALLETLMRHPSQVLSRDQLLGHVWGLDFDPSSNIVDVYIRALRKKIGETRLVTVRGIGYKFIES